MFLSLMVAIFNVKAKGHVALLKFPARQHVIRHGRKDGARLGL
jgi:hypothetical protein